MQKAAVIINFVGDLNKISERDLAKQKKVNKTLKLGCRTHLTWCNELRISVFKPPPGRFGIFSGTQTTSPFQKKKYQFPSLVFQPLIYSFFPNINFRLPVLCMKEYRGAFTFMSQL